MEENECLCSQRGKSDVPPRISALFCVRRVRSHRGISLISLYIKSKHECGTQILRQAGARKQWARSKGGCERLVFPLITGEKASCRYVNEHIHGPTLPFGRARSARILARSDSSTQGFHSSVQPMKRMIMTPVTPRGKSTNDENK